MASTKAPSKLAKPKPITRAEKKTLARILKKARAFKAFYAQNGGVSK